MLRVAGWASFGCVAALVLGCSGSDAGGAGTGGGSSGGNGGGAGAAGAGGAGGATHPSAEFWLASETGAAPVSRAFWGDPYYLRVTGLAPHGHVRISARADTIDQYETTSFVEVDADADGTVDLSRDAPTDGTYSGVDPDGLVWSAAPAADGENQLAFDAFAVSVLDGDQEIATATLDRYYLADGVTELDVSDNGLVGIYYAPNDGKAHPAIITFGGSEGGLTSGEYEAAYWVSRGYAALGLAYFAAPGLPQNLTQIPLGYFDKAHDFLATRSDADASKVAVMGGSRGGELALLLGATFPWVKAVVAELPSGVSWGSPQWSGPELASWSYGGNDLPFVPGVIAQPETSVDAEGNTLFHYRNTFEAAIAAATPSELDLATARAENTQGPVLMIAGADDQVWPACDLGALAWKRLEDAGHTAKYADQLLCLDSAGHNVGTPGSPTLGADEVQHPITKEWLALGGTPAGIAHASRKADSAVQKLLRDALK
jgi:dienelactone hydrolase